MKFCVIKRNDRFLGREYDEGYYYSDVTFQEGSFDITYRDLDELLNDNEACLVIFEDKDKAAKWLVNNIRYSIGEYSIVNLGEL